MYSGYLKAMNKLNSVKNDIEQLLDEGLKETAQSFEDKKAQRILENVLDEIAAAASSIKRYSLPTIEGKLMEDMERNKFELIRQDNGKGLGWYFSCGVSLEIYDEESMEWYSGRVEHTTKDGQTGYYFYCHDLDGPFLYSGMRARIRRDNEEE
jgi:hypothetical protein